MKFLWRLCDDLFFLSKTTQGIPLGLISDIGCLAYLYQIKNKSTLKPIENLGKQKEKPPTHGNASGFSKDTMCALYQQLDLFHNHEAIATGKNYLPNKPYCTDDLNFGIKPRSFVHAIKRKYIQVNPPNLRLWLLFDVDRAGGALAWEDGNLPMPAWAAVNRQNKHAHLAYALSAPVMSADYAHQAPLRYLTAIEHAYRERLEADDGFAGLITKNPIHPHWELLKGIPEAIRGYDLDYLAEFGNVEKFRPYAHVKVDCIGLGRNCTVFERCRHWAYREIKKYRGGAITPWHEAVLNHCLNLNAEFPTPMLYAEVKCIAKSISKWIWQNFQTHKPEFIALQKYRSSQRKTFAGRKKIITEI